MKYSELKAAYKHGVADCVSPYSENNNMYDDKNLWYMYNRGFNGQFVKLKSGKTWEEIDNEWQDKQLTFEGL